MSIDRSRDFQIALATRTARPVVVERRAGETDETYAVAVPTYAEASQVVAYLPDWAAEQRYLSSLDWVEIDLTGKTPVVRIRVDLSGVRGGL